MLYLERGGYHETLELILKSMSVIGWYDEVCFKNTRKTSQYGIPTSWRKFTGKDASEWEL